MTKNIIKTAAAILSVVAVFIVSQANANPWDESVAIFTQTQYDYQNSQAAWHHHVSQNQRLR